MRTRKVRKPTSHPPNHPATDHFNQHLRRGIEAREAAVGKSSQQQKRCTVCDGPLPVSTSMSAGDGEAIIQVSNITGPVTISHVEGVPESETTSPPPPTSNQIETEAAARTSGDLKAASKREQQSKHLITSTAAVITSGAAIATGVGVLATSLRQLLRPLMGLNGLGSLPLTPRSMVAALAAIVGTALVSSSIAAITTTRARTSARRDIEPGPTPNQEQLKLFAIEST